MRSMPPAAHWNEEVLEIYALGQSAPEETDAIEEHLLVCCECQDRLRKLDEFISALQATLNATDDHSLTGGGTTRDGAQYERPG